MRWVGLPAKQKLTAEPGRLEPVRFWKGNREKQAVDNGPSPTAAFDRLQPFDVVRDQAGGFFSRKRKESVGSPAAALDI